MMRIATAAGLMITLAAVLIGSRPPRQGVRVDERLSSYKKVDGMKGNLSSVGSDTLNSVMNLWAERFKRHYPDVDIQVQGKGSGTAIPAIIQGAAQLGPMSRSLEDTERQAFEKKFGYKVTPIRAAVDALAVFVHRDNPIESLTLAQLDAIFSKTRRRGHPEDIRTWGQLGLKGEWADKPIILYGRNSLSGSYRFFKKTILADGDYKNDIKEKPGSASVVLGVTQDRYAIGYGGIGYAVSIVRSVPLQEKPSDPPLRANAKNAYSGVYPLSRFLFICINKAPGKPLPSPTREFIRYILSKEGQKAVVKKGDFPLSAAIASEELKKIE